MQISRVVVNASPLICLFKNGLENLFQELFQDIVVPDAVIKEVMAEGVYDCACKTLLSHDWLRRAEDSPIEPYVASWDLGFGESSVLSFALKNPEYWAIIDDLEARRCAMSLQCRYTGTVGIILLAKKRKIITSLRDNLMQLKNVGLWLSDNLVNELCSKSGE